MADNLMTDALALGAQMDKKVITPEVILAAVGNQNQELIISGRGSMLTVILTKYSGGSCLCIPEIGIGSPLGHLSDTFWNFEQLSHLINRTDATTIAYALADYNRYKT